MNTANDVELVAEQVGKDQYKITARAQFDGQADSVWPLLLNWERFVEVGLPGMTSNFQWVSGGPGVVPSKFQFDMAGATLKEEIYEQKVDLGQGLYLLRYRTLEPALGVVEYDAALFVQQLPGTGTSFEAIREVQLEPGTLPDMLADVVKSETQCLKCFFAV
jgi:hypothetical protein